MSHHNSSQDDGYYYDQRDYDDEPEGYEERVRLADGIWMIRLTWPDGTAMAHWTIRQPNGGTWIYVAAGLETPGAAAGLERLAAAPG